MSRFPQADKRLGQHFLASSHVIGAITGDRGLDNDAIVEVGPGPAVLTARLADHGLPLYLIERDRRFEEDLLRHVPTERLLLQDALEMDWEGFLSERGHQRVWLVSNLPYNVSVPLTLAFMRCPRIQRMTLMYQKEVAEKFLPRNGRNEMGSLASLTGIYFNARRLVDVPPGAFVPPPKVMSQVISFERQGAPPLPLLEWSALEEFLRLLFQNRRKQMQGVLRERLPVEVLTPFLHEQELAAGVRAEALTLSQVIALYRLDRDHNHGLS